MKFWTVAGLSWSNNSTRTLLGPEEKPEIWKLIIVPCNTVRVAELAAFVPEEPATMTE